MLSYIVFAMIILIGLLVVIQESNERENINITYFLVLLCHWAFSSIAFTDESTLMGISHASLYFWLAAFINVALITHIEKCKYTTNLSKEIQYVCIVMVIFQMTRWGLDINYIAAPSFDWLFVVIYGAAIYALYKKEPEHERRSSRVDNWLSAISPYAYKKHSLDNNH